MKEDILPDAQNPTTSIPTFVLHGDNREIEACTYENYVTALDKDAMQAITHKFYENYNIGFASVIKNMVITVPEFEYPNIAILDTPGYNKADMDKKQEKLTDEKKTMEQISVADFLIWLVDSEGGTIKEDDIKFFGKIGINTPILFVFNKADKRTENDLKILI